MELQGKDRKEQRKSEQREEPRYVQLIFWKTSGSKVLRMLDGVQDKKFDLGSHGNDRISSWEIKTWTRSIKGRTEDECQIKDWAILKSQFRRIHTRRSQAR